MSKELTAQATLDGYEFVGWSLSPNGEKITSVNYEKGSLDEFEFTLKLYALWEQNKYFIKYNLTEPAVGETVYCNGETFVFINFVDGTAKEPTKYLSITSNGYIFVKWQIKGKDISLDVINEELLNSDVIYLSPVWEAKKFVITYNVNGGDALSKTTQEVTYNNNYTLVTPTRTGYKFNGWKYNNTVFNNGNSSGTWKNYSNITLKADWKAKTYKITYAVNGGKELSPNCIDVTYDASYKLDTPSRDKNGNTTYTFDKWEYGEKTIPINGTWKYDWGDITIVAKWKEDSTCVTGDTKILLANGDSAKIRDLKVGDLIKTWNFRTGQIDELPVSIIFNHGYFLGI